MVKFNLGHELSVERFDYVGIFNQRRIEGCFDDQIVRRTFSILRSYGYTRLARYYDER